MEQELNINEEFTYMNETSSKITSLFAKTEARSDELEKIVQLMSEEANIEHRTNCKHDDSCRGVAPYLLKRVKLYFIAHGELTEFDRLGIMSAISYSIGIHNAERFDGIAEMLKGDRENGVPSFKEFMDDLHERVKGMKDSE